MRKVTILNNSDTLIDEFARCCAKYDKIDLAVAWCGNPSQILPFKYLECFEGDIRATIGVSFCHTHPDSFEWLKHIGADYRIFNDGSDLFHPKVYIFSDVERKGDRLLFRS
jgi:hypothetical protein